MNSTRVSKCFLCTEESTEIIAYYFQKKEFTEINKVIEFVQVQDGALRERIQSSGLAINVLTNLNNLESYIHLPSSSHLRDQLIRKHLSKKKCRKAWVLYYSGNESWVIIDDGI